VTKLGQEILEHVVVQRSILQLSRHRFPLVYLVDVDVGIGAPSIGVKVQDLPIQSPD